MISFLRPLAASMTVTAMFAAAPASADNLMTFLDLSDSAPPGVEQPVANDIAGVVEKAVRAMDRDECLTLRSFGLAGVSETQLRVDACVSRKWRPNEIAARVGAYIRDVPGKVTTGKIHMEPKTDALAALEIYARDIDCQSKPTKIVIFSDGYQYASGTDLKAVLAGRALPSPSGPIFAGCKVEMYGIAQQRREYGTSREHFIALERAWGDWFREAGAKSFRGYGTYHGAI